MVMRKKVVSVLLACAMCLSMAACSSGVPEKEHQKVLDEKAQLESQVQKLESQAQDLESQLAEAEEKLAATPTPSPTPEPSPSPAPEATAKATEAPTPEPKQEAVSAGKKNALKMAKSYLDYSGFSYTGLIEQLEYEKFTNEEATYAADNCGADWNEQAARVAQSYLDYSAFSRDGLIEQLEYEGFTNDQAVYGVNAVGL